MSFSNNIISKKDDVNESYADFWFWFQENERGFYKAIKDNKNVNQLFIEIFLEKLNELKGEIYFLVGMINNDISEIIFTADGVVKNIACIEDLVNAAPQIEGWAFTVLKPEMDIENVAIELEGYRFNGDNLSFYASEHLDYPDLVEIVVVYNNYKEVDKQAIHHGVYVFLDNYLGELDFAYNIDNLIVTGKGGLNNELIPIEKLKDYLIWRKKEFVEKYEGTWHDTESDKYCCMEGELENKMPIIAVINTDLLNWDAKASHPWMTVFELKFIGNSNGQPDITTYDLLDTIENDLETLLKDKDGYLNLGRETVNNSRLIFFACKEFRKPSKAANEIVQKYTGQLNIDYDIFKDKYWQSMNRFVA